MEKKWSVAVNVLGVLILLAALVYIVVFIPELKYIEGIGDAFKFLLWCIPPIFFGIGILKRKKWARTLCLLATWIIGGIFILTSPMAGETGAWQVIITTLVIVGLITAFLFHPKVKEQFK